MPEARYFYFNRSLYLPICLRRDQPPPSRGCEPRLAAHRREIDVQRLKLEVLAGTEIFIHNVEIVITEIYAHRFIPRLSLVHEVIGLMRQNEFRIYRILVQLWRPHDNAIDQSPICFAREGHELLDSTS